MYRKFFKFKKYPFCNTPDTEFFYESENHTEALSSLIYAIKERKGFATITGDIGAGKTIISRKLLNKLESNVEVGLIPNTCIREDNFLKVICDEFHLPTKDFSEVELLSSLNEYLLRSLEEDKNVVLIIDEAQNLPLSTLEKIRMLSNLETEKEKLLQIILLGQSELKELLSQPESEQIRQRIHVWFHLKALNKQEAYEYIAYRLQIAGYNGPELFTQQAISQIFHFSKGVPRIINTISDNALLIAFVRGVQKVDHHIIEEVAKDLGYTAEVKEKPVLEWKKKSAPYYSSSPALVFASLIVVLGIFHLFDKEQASVNLRQHYWAQTYLNSAEEKAFSVDLNMPVEVSSLPGKSFKKSTKSKSQQPLLVTPKKVKFNFVPTESELD